MRAENKVQGINIAILTPFPEGDYKASQALQTLPQDEIIRAELATLFSPTVASEICKHGGARYLGVCRSCLRSECSWHQENVYLIVVSLEKITRNCRLPEEYKQACP